MTNDVLSTLTDIRATAGGYEAQTLPSAHGGVLGAHQLFQQVLIASKEVPDKRVLSLQTSFFRGGRATEPISVSVETMQQGRSFSFLELTFRQGDVLMTRSTVLMTADEPDYKRLQALEPQVRDFAGWPESFGLPPGVMRKDPESTRRLRTVAVQLDEPVDASTTRALIALACEPEVHTAIFEPGLGEPDSPFGTQTSFVLQQSVNFFEDADLRAGMLVRTVADYAGRGRTSGHGEVVSPEGVLLATYSMVGMMRARND